MQCTEAGSKEYNSLSKNQKKLVSQLDSKGNPLELELASDLAKKVSKKRMKKLKDF